MVQNQTAPVLERFGDNSVATEVGREALCRVPSVAYDGWMAVIVVHKRIDISVPEGLYWVQPEAWCATCNPARNDL